MSRHTKSELSTTITTREVEYIVCDCCGHSEKESECNNLDWLCVLIKVKTLEMCPQCSAKINAFIEGLGK